MTTSTLVMSLQAIPDRVWAVRKFVEAYYERVLDDPDLLDRLAMVTHELLENAAKYAAQYAEGGHSELRIAYAREEVPPTLEIAVTSRIDPHDVAPLTELVERLRCAEDIQVLYLQMIRESATRKVGSGLGLIRICAEGEMTLHLDTHDGHACIRARTVAGEDPGDAP